MSVLHRPRSSEQGHKMEQDRKFTYKVILGVPKSW